MLLNIFRLSKWIAITENIIASVDFMFAYTYMKCWIVTHLMKYILQCINIYLRNLIFFFNAVYFSILAITYWDYHIYAISWRMYGCQWIYVSGIGRRKYSIQAITTTKETDMHMATSSLVFNKKQVSTSRKRLSGL